MRFDFAPATNYAKAAVEKVPQRSQPYILIAQIETGRATGLAPSFILPLAINV
jgi:hypothetical protein